jgi:site-specific recombinase XerD
LLGAESYLRLTDNPGKRFTIEEIEAAGERWSKRQCLPPVRVSPRLSEQRFVCVARRWLRFMGRLEEPIRVGPLNPLLAEFAEFLRVERSLAPITIESRCWIISKCLAGIPSEHALQVFTVADLDTLLLHKVVDGGYSRSTVSLWASTLRSFFRYGESRGWCKPGIAAAIMAPRVFTDETLPSGQRWEDVRRLLKSSERDSPAGIRDYGILLVFAIYGVRAGEVARLCLDDINWTKETITFARSKVHRRDCFPLISVAGDALIRYLREARPKTTDRRVFLTARAPIRPVTSGTLCAIVTRPLRALGIDLKHYGPHALRHACATHLINQGLSLKEIGDHLGHRDADSTRIYAKVDLKHLREIARFDLGGVL